METTAYLLPVAGGKGGVGKSVIAANTAIALAQMGFRTVAVDMDLGGSNLHSFLGLPNQYPGVGDFIRGGDAALPEFLVPTGETNLKFLPGDGLAPFTANISYHQKKQLLAAIENLPVDFVVMDLGAGTSFNVLDYFGISRRGFLVTTPEFPAIISMLGFLKNFLFRRFEQQNKKNEAVRNLLEALFNRPTGDRQMTVTAIRNAAAEVDEDAADIIDKTCAALRPGIIFNMGTHPDEMAVIKQFQRGLNTVLSLEADYLGFVFSDPSVSESLKKRKPLLMYAPDGPAAMEIKQIARRVVRFKDRPADNSAERLIESTREFYGKNIGISDKG